MANSVKKQEKNSNIYQMTPVMCHLSPVTCHQRQQPQLQTLPLLPPPLCTIAWFSKKEIFFWRNQPIYPPKKYCQNILKLKKNDFPILAIRSSTWSLQSMRFWVPANGTDNRRTLQLFIDLAGLGDDKWKWLEFICFVISAGTAQTKAIQTIPYR